MAFKAAPLNTSFLLVSIIGFAVSVVYIVKYSYPWATAFATVFVVMFVASFISMSRATPDEQLSPRIRRKLGKVE